jgi:hypothetical protein
MEFMDGCGCFVRVGHEEPGRDPCGSILQGRGGEDGSALELELQVDRADPVAEAAIDQDLGRVQPTQGDTLLVQTGEMMCDHLAQDATATMVGVHRHP